MRNYDYTNRLIAALDEHGIETEIAGTGGGCEEIAVLPDYRFGITNGDAAVPESGWEILVVETDPDEGTEEIASRYFREFDTPADAASAIAGWINSRN